ncbi:MAG: hypothetical protein OJI70_04160 [Zavarzinia sp.]|nr:hypothetical protein [Zavarzinia sp.]
MTTRDPDDKSWPADDPISRAAALAASLPADQAARLLADLSAGMAAKGERTAPLRQALIEQANRQRPQRARRLFTSLVHPLLTDDPEDIDSPLPMPLCFRRADMGGIWGALARSAFPDLARDAANLMDSLCAECLVDEAIERPEAQAMRDRLRLAAIAKLNQLAADRSTSEAFCTLANMIREKQYGLRTRHMAPIGIQHLSDLVEVLTAQPLWAPAVATLLRVTPPHADPLASGEALIRATSDLSQTLLANNLPSGTADILAIALINRRGAFGAVAVMLAQRGAGKVLRVGEAVVATLSAHFQIHVAVMTQGATNTRHEDFPITLSDDVKYRLANNLNMIDEIVAAVRESGLADVPRLFPMLRDATNNLMAELVRSPLQRSSLRLSAALFNRSQVTSDTTDVMFLISQLVRLRALLRPTGLPIIALNKWRDQIVADIEFAVQKATRLEDGEEPLPDRFRHLERIERLAEAMGNTIVPILQPTSRHTQLIITSRLDEPGPLDGLALRLCSGYVNTVRAEIAKVRYWRNPDMVALAEKATSRGL